MSMLTWQGLSYDNKAALLSGCDDPGCRVGQILPGGVQDTVELFVSREGKDNRDCRSGRGSW